MVARRSPARRADDNGSWPRWTAETILRASGTVTCSALASASGVTDWRGTTRWRYHVACYLAAVFGLSFTEFLVVIVVGLVVLGPKDLPRYLRKAGQFAGQIRNWAFDMRHKSGNHENFRVHGLDRHFAYVRKL